MKQPDPLQTLTYVVGLGLLLVLGRFAVTGDPPSSELLSALGVMFGALTAALGTRGKGKDEGEGKSKKGGTDDR